MQQLDHFGAFYSVSSLLEWNGVRVDVSAAPCDRTALLVPFMAPSHRVTVARLRNDHDQAIGNLAENMNRHSGEWFRRRQAAGFRVWAIRNRVSAGGFVGVRYGKVVSYEF